jgi:hypothetical protein
MNDGPISFRGAAKKLNERNIESSMGSNFDLRESMRWLHFAADV